MLNEELILKMIEFDAGSAGLIQHFIKVYEFAHVIGVKEGIPAETLRILDIASILHDIAIKPCMEKFGRGDGKIQEQEGPAYARALLADFPEVTADEVERVCFLIAHHHTTENVVDIDHQILLEADFLVNSFEGKMTEDAIRTFEEKVFQTSTGKWMLETQFGK